LIIKPNKTETEEIEDHIMHVGDWFHDRSSEVGVQKQKKKTQLILLNIYKISVVIKIYQYI